MENSGDSLSGSNLPREVSVLAFFQFIISMMNGGSSNCLYADHPFLIGFLKLSGALLLIISGFLTVCLSLSKFESSLTVSNGPVDKFYD